MNTLHAKRLWLLLRWDLLNGIFLVGFMVAGFWALDFAAFLCRAEGWCS